ncbi:MAG: DNA primase [Bacteroidales bacterium]
MIDKSTIDDIFSISKIEEVVGDFVNLKKRGANYVGLCPFHNEKTPSFVVSPAKGIYKCFGCGKAGNSVNFVMEHEKYSYPEALKYLAQKYNIPITETELSTEQKEEFEIKDQIFNLNSFAQKYFSDILFNDNEGKNIGLSYFKERGFLEKTIKNFVLGYSPNKFDAFYNYAIKNGYKEELLQEAGLITKTDNGKILDKFRGRVIFPIHNLSGRIIGFGGRIMDSTSKTAKYLNSPETPVYIKSNSLYGIYYAKNDIVKNDFCYLVEGYTDVITMNQAGLSNVVASSGTSLTTQQIRLIKRYTNNITVIFDGDTAGIKASLRGIDMILEEGLNVKIIPLPADEDPDNFVRNNSLSEVEKYFIENEKDFINYKTELLLEETKNDPIKKVEVVKDILNSIAVIPDAITRQVYVKECADMMELQEQTLIYELNKVIRKNLRDKNKQAERDVEETILENTDLQKPVTDENINKIFEQSFEDLEKGIIEKLLKFGDQLIDLPISDDEEEGEKEEMDELKDKNLLDNLDSDQTIENDGEYEKVLVGHYIISQILGDEITFKHPTYQKILEIYNDELLNGNIPDQKFFINYHDHDIAQTCIDLIAEKYTISENWRKEYEIFIRDESHYIQETVDRAINSYKAAFIKRKLIEIEKQIKECKDEEEIIYLMKYFMEYKKTECAINKYLERVIT